MSFMFARETEFISKNWKLMFPLPNENLEHFIIEKFLSVWDYIWIWTQRNL